MYFLIDEDYAQKLQRNCMSAVFYKHCAQYCENLTRQGNWNGQHSIIWQMKRSKKTGNGKEQSHYFEELI